MLSLCLLMAPCCVLAAAPSCRHRQPTCGTDALPSHVPAADDYPAAPNLDHSQERVRRDIIEWLRFLRNSIGFDGWRFDYVKVCGGVLPGNALPARQLLPCQDESMWGCWNRNMSPPSAPTSPCSRSGL